jgi:diguanylate cyclase (GGDEF)-like protein/PAS domain S-box-containing protein
VIWLVFNIGIALLLMELGVFDALQKVLGLYSNFAIAWIAVVVADLTINKSLKLSPPVIEFKRAHLYDYNPVGVVSMGIAVLSSTLAFTGLFGLYAQAYSWLIALVTAFVLTPLIAKLTKGKYYIARQNVHFSRSDELSLCGVCEQHYAQTDFAYCTFHDTPICSLCCTLDSSCKDSCKPKHISIYQQAALYVLDVIFNHKISTQASVRIARFVLISGVMLGIVGLTFWLTYSITNDSLTPQFVTALNANLFNLFCVLAVLICILAWWIVLGHESQALAETELEEQNQRLEVEITERRQAETALKESETFHRAVFDATPDAMFLSDEQGIITQANQQTECLLGYQTDEIIGLSIDVLLPERLRAGHKVLCVKFTDSPVVRPMSSGMNVPALRKDGSEVNVEISLSPIQTRRGLIIASALRDVTQRKQMEDTLRASEERFRRMANASPAMIWVTDVNGNPIFVNQTWLDFTGSEFKEAMTYEGWTKLIHPDDRKSNFVAYYKNINAHKPILTEYRLRHADGDWHWILDKGVPLYTETGLFSGYIGSAIDITERKQAEAEIERLAFYDPLTGLPNRRLLQDRLKLSLASSHRSGRLGALLFIDMDNFKTLNDTLGHNMGDLLLQQVAGRLESCIREGDTIARLGGDEFVVMMEDLSEQAIEAATQTETIGNKILATLNQPYQLASHDYHSTPSIGAILFNDHEQTIEELLKQADIAMYQAKASGRNALRFFDPQMQVSIAARAAMEADLHLALAENQFMLYYQPQVYHNRQVIGAEVLIRWQHPQRGLVPPVDFIPLTEETGLILPIGQWVLETACAQIKLWEGSEHTQHLQLAVNVSVRQFRQTDFVDQICQILRRSAINPNRLKLELTETLVLDNIDDTIIKMNALQKIGVRFSMDDFGTGYSSLAYLTQLPFDQLKIDQSFVRNIGMKPTDSMIVQTIIGMAKNLAMQVIAEGVETEAQRAFLEQYDCPLFQGFLISRPVPIEQFEQLLKRN